MRITAAIAIAIGAYVLTGAFLELWETKRVEANTKAKCGCVCGSL